MKTALKILGALIAALFVLILCLLEWPGIAINSHTLAWGAKFISGKKDMPQIHWDQARVQVHHRGLFSNQLVFDFKNFCFEHSSYGHGCMETAQGAFAYGFKRGLPRLLEVGPAHVRADEITLQVPEEKAATKTVTVTPKTKAPQRKSRSTLLNYARIEPIDIQVKHWVFALPNLKAEGDYSLQLGPKPAPAQGSLLSSRINLKLASHAMNGALNSTAHLIASAQNPDPGIYGPWKGRLELEALSPKLEAHLNTLATLAEGRDQHLDFNINNRYVSPLGKADIDIFGWTIPAEEVRGQVRGTIEPTRSQKQNAMSLLSLLQMNRFQFKSCSFDFINPGHEEEDGKLLTDCRVDTQIVRFRLYGKEQPPIKLWRELGMRLKTDIVLPGPKHDQDPYHGEIVLAPFSDPGSELQLAGQVATHLEIMPAEVPVPRELKTSVDLSMTIPKFEKLVKSLADTPVAIPAPLRTLKGEAFFNTKGNLTLNQGGILAMDLGSHLNQAPDRLNAVGGGKVTIEALRTAFDRPPRIPGVDANLDISLTDIHLTLPKTGISVPPKQILPDPRIHSDVPDATQQITKNTQHGELSNVHYLVRVTTPKNQPIEIASQLLKSPIKLGLDLRLREGQPWMGFAEINGNKEPVGLPTSQMAGQAAEERTGPKLPFGFSELASSFLTGVPIEAVTQQPQAGEDILPKREETRISSMIELRRRY